MDVNWRPTVDEAQLGNWCRTIVGENQCIAGDMHNVGSRTVVKRIQRCFAWTYKDSKGIPPKLAHHVIELDTIIALTHQAKYKFNPNYVTIVKQNINKC